MAPQKGSLQRLDLYFLSLFFVLFSHKLGEGFTATWRRGETDSVGKSSRGLYPFGGKQLSYLETGKHGRPDLGREGKIFFVFLSLFSIQFSLSHFLLISFWFALFSEAALHCGIPMT